MASGSSGQVASQAEVMQGSVQGTADESQNRQLQISPEKGQKRMHGTSNVSKPPKKMRKTKDEEAIPSEDRPKRGGRKLETNTSAEMSNPDDYKTIEGETYHSENKSAAKD
jgi:hypothetical protein